MHPKCTIEQWRVFQAVVSQGGYAEAAEYLNKSQSTVSYAISQLQLRLGKPLFKVQGRKARLTPFGEIMLHRSRILLDDALQLEKIAHKTQEGWPAEILIVVDDPLPRRIVSKALNTFKAFAETKVQIQEQSLSGCIEVLEQDIADIVIAHSVPKGYMEFAQVQITQVAVAHKDNLLHHLPQPLSLDDLKRETQLVVADSGQHLSVDKGWLDAPNRWRVSSSQLSVELLLENIGFAWLPLAYINQHQSILKPLNLTRGQRRQFYLNCLFGKKGSPNLAALKMSECLKNAIDQKV